jgi:hypothetical protein
MQFAVWRVGRPAALSKAARSEVASAHVGKSNAAAREPSHKKGKEDLPRVSEYTKEFDFSTRAKYLPEDLSDHFATLAGWWNNSAQPPRISTGAQQKQPPQGDGCVVSETLANQDLRSTDHWSKATDQGSQALPNDGKAPSGEIIFQDPNFFRSPTMWTALRSGKLSGFQTFRPVIEL